MKKCGPDGIGISELMQQAGLTHGGFYAHFRSRDELTSRAFELGMDQTISRWKTSSAGLSGADALETIVRLYLSESHRDNPSKGCSLPSFSAAIVRNKKVSRTHFTVKLEEMLDLLASHVTNVSAAEARQRAVCVVATMMGAISLARASAGHPVSAEMLDVNLRSLISHKIVT
jgi:TetR/AcrR family transcriptional repressor of nem operon